MKRHSGQSASEILEERIGRIQRRKEWWHLLLECLVVAAAIYLVFQYVIGVAVVSGRSMEPSLWEGELAVFYRLDSDLQPGDIVLIRQEENAEYIKRIVAEAGDTVDISGDGVLLVNGEAEESTRAVGVTQAAAGDLTYPYTVPEGSYFVLGDNRENSRDSRDFGAVSRAEITGRVFLHLGMLR